MNNRLKLIIKVAVSAGLLTVLLKMADLEVVADAVSRADWRLIALSFVLWYVHYTTAASRWRLIARLHHADASLGFYVRSYMVTHFFNNFLPSTVGGDIVRVYDTWKTGATKAGAAATVLVDRILGVLALAIVAAIGVFILGQRSALPSGLTVILGVLIVAQLAFVLLLFHPPRWWLSLVTQLAAVDNRLVSRIATIFQQVTREFEGQGQLLIRSLLLSFVIHLNTVITYYLVGKAVGIDLDFWVYVGVVPIALIIMMIPLSINGIGLREGAFTVLLGQFGVEVSLALTFSWVYYGMTLVHGVIGGVVYAFRKGHVRKSIDDLAHDEG